MNTKTKNQLRVKEGKTELTVKHLGEDLTFIYPAYGPEDYANVGKEIEQAGLKKPTMAQTASLVHSAFNSNDRYSQEIKKLIKNKWLWAFTGILYIQSKGAYIQDNPKIRNKMPFMKESDLIKKLESNDPSVRFVPYGHKSQEMTPSELAKNEYVIALAGEEGAEKLAEVADKHKNKPYLWSSHYVGEPKTGVSSVGLYRWRLGPGLGVNGHDRGYDWYCCALGVQEKTSKAIRTKK